MLGFRVHGDAAASAARRPPAAARRRRPGIAAPRRPDDPGERAVEVVNPSDGGFFYWLLRFYAFGLLLRRSASLLLGRLRHLPLLRGDAADAARPRDLPRGRRHHDGDARLGRDAAGRAGHRAARDPAVRQVPAAARPRLSRRRGPPLLRAPGASTTAASRARWARTCAPARSPQGGSTITQQVAKSFLTSERTIAAQDPRGDPGAAAGAALLEARHPDAVPEPDLPGPRRLRRGGGGAPLLRQGGRRSRSGRDGAARRPGARAVAVLAAHQPRGGARAARSGAGHDGGRAAT